MQVQKRSIFSIVVLFTLLLSLCLPTIALADDITPPPEPATVTTEVASGDAPAASAEASSSEPPATDSASTVVVPIELAPGEAAPAEAPADTIIDMSFGIAPGGPIQTIPTSDVAVVDVVSTSDEIPGQESVRDITEVLADTNNVLVDDQGNPVPLALQVAAEVLTNSDPYFDDGTGTFVGYSASGICPIIVSVGNCHISSTPLQDAITAAPVGATVIVQAGSYVEQLTINKSLIVSGAGAATTTILSPGTLTPDSNGLRSIVTINGSGVTVDFSGFTVSGPGPGGSGFINFGIFVGGGATANIHDNVITDVRDNPFSGGQHGTAIQVGRNAIASIGTATINNNTIEDYQKNGITVDGIGSSAIIKGNTITGAGPTNIIAQNGIQISRGAVATLDGNTISGNVYSPISDSATGVLLFQPGNVQILNNDLRNNEINLYGYESASTFISGNIFANATLNGVMVDGVSTSTIITGNLFTGNPEGLGVADGFTSPIFTVKGNSFVDNSLGVKNYTTSATDVIALGNWWGCSTGPASPSCDQVSTYVIVDPWLVTDPFAGTIFSSKSEPLTGESLRHKLANPFVGSISQVIPITGGETIELSCVSSSTRLFLNGIIITLDSLCTYSVVADEVVEAGLPTKLSGGEAFTSGISFTLLKSGQPIAAIPEGAQARIAFPIPIGFEGKTLAILSWDGVKWVEETVSISGGYAIVNVTNPGAYILVVK